MKNNVDIFYFTCDVPIHIVFQEDGDMDKRVFLSTWNDTPAENEKKFDLPSIKLGTGETLSTTLTFKFLLDMVT